jgi:undecaprenyl-diphosphatase
LEILQSILLGVIQGLTEFLPVSSSAHLEVIPQLLKIRSALLNSLSFDVALHTGTLCAVLAFFWKKILNILAAFFKGLFDKATRETADFRMAVYLIIATIPAVIVAVLFEKQIEGALRNPLYTGIMLVVFGVIL